MDIIIIIIAQQR
jgi:hypothetical protein